MTQFKITHTVQNNNMCEFVHVSRSEILEQITGIIYYFSFPSSSLSPLPFPKTSQEYGQRCKLSQQDGGPRGGTTLTGGRQLIYVLTWEIATE